MDTDNNNLQITFTYLYFLMLSADSIADLKEMEFANKIIELEGFDKPEILKGLDTLSSLDRENILESAVNYLKVLDKPTQLRFLAYIKLMSKADGSMDPNEFELLRYLGQEKLDISMEEIAVSELEVQKKLRGSDA